MDYSTITYLMGPEGKLVTVIAYQEDDASAVAKLRIGIANAFVVVGTLAFCRVRILAESVRKYLRASRVGAAYQFAFSAGGSFSDGAGDRCSLDGWPSLGRLVPE